VPLAKGSQEIISDIGLVLPEKFLKELLTDNALFQTAVDTLIYRWELWQILKLSKRRR
jgi:hypothetical protein